MASRSPVKLSRSLPQWLRSWAEECLDCDVQALSQADIRQFPALEAKGFRRMLGDPTVAEALANLEGSDGRSTQRDLIKEILATTCQSYHLSKSIISKTPSVAKKELRALAKSADRLAQSLHEQGNLIDTATNLRYLIERATTDDPDRFMLKRRAGLRRASYPAHRENTSLIDLLEAFADDITEELSLFPHRIDQLDGAVDATIRYQIKYLKRAYRSLFGKPDNAVIAHLLSAINQTSIDRSRVAKVKV
jgi:hypothetical protein